MATRRTTISLPPELARRVEAVARKEKRTFSGAIARLIEEALRSRKSSFRSFGAAHGRGGLTEREEEILREVFDRLEK